MESGEMDLLSKQAILSLPRDVEKSLDGKILDEYINVKDIEALPTVQSQSTAGQLNDSAQSTNLIDRQAAIDAIDEERKQRHLFNTAEDGLLEARRIINTLPSTQPEHTCLTCGRTANNGGWYKDGRTRCPIEEHYALPKDGYCHLWEKRNITDDDYPERRTDD